MSKIKNWIKGTGNYEVKETVISLGDKTAPINFQYGWTTINATVSGATTYTTSASGGVRYNNITTIGKRYRVKITGNSTTSIDLKNYEDTIIYLTLGTSFNITFEFTAQSMGIFLKSSAGSVTISHLSIIEIPPLPTITTGTKYLENTTSGTASIQSKQAYGTWEFDVYKGVIYNDSVIQITTTNSNTTLLNGSTGYGVRLFPNNGVFYFYKGNAPILSTASSYLANNTWYRIKVARLQSEGVFNDIPTLQTSDCVNSSVPYTSFTSNGKYGFSAISNGVGIQIGGVPDELPIINGAKYLVEFNLKLNSGSSPYINFAPVFGSAGISNLVQSTNGRNSFILTATTSTTAVLQIYSLNGSATDYEISGLTIRRIYDANSFAVFIKGGSFGDDNWTLISTTGGSGTNPVTDSTYTTSNYLVADLDAGDRLANIKIMDGVKQ